MKIAFVDPKGIHFGLNTGLAYIVSSLKKSGRSDIRVFDFNNNTSLHEQRIEQLSSYDVIGFSVKSFTRENAISIASQVKRSNNILVAGGPHISLDGMNFLNENNFFDYAVSGEGEHSMIQLMEVIEGTGKLENIKGIIYRKKGIPMADSTAERIMNLDLLPFPEYINFDSISEGRIYNYPLVTSRGCPYHCSYCCVKAVMGKRWVARSVDNIITELKEVQRQHSSTIFNIQDDNFTLDIQRAHNFCEAILKEDLSFKWSCPNGIRADRLDKKLIAAMKRAGCFMVAFGIESGNEKEYNAINKGEKHQDIVNAVNIAQQHGIYVIGNFIIGLPNSTLMSIRETIKFAKTLRLEACVFNLLVPFPGTEIWAWVKKNGQLLIDWREGFTQGGKPKVVFETDDFPLKDRIKAYYESNIKCNNYFAFMDEHDNTLKNIWNIMKTILKYDLINLHNHITWAIRHSGRIIARITRKNA
jgi:radical SAM superfamily enzyme YgiQ (UPF0313 family)